MKSSVLLAEFSREFFHVLLMFVSKIQTKSDELCVHVYRPSMNLAVMSVLNKYEQKVLEKLIFLD
jgi:hypothetical protein